MSRFMKEGESYTSPHDLSVLEHRRGRVRLEVKRAFTPAGCCVSVYGWAPPVNAPSWLASQRTVLMRVILPRSASKEAIRAALGSLLHLTLLRLGTSKYHLRAKVRV